MHASPIMIHTFVWDACIFNYCSPKRVCLSLSVEFVSHSVVFFYRKKESANSSHSFSNKSKCQMVISWSLVVWPLFGHLFGYCLGYKWLLKLVK